LAHADLGWDLEFALDIFFQAHGLHFNIVSEEAALDFDCHSFAILSHGVAGEAEDAAVGAMPGFVLSVLCAFASLREAFLKHLSQRRQDAKEKRQDDLVSCARYFTT
jgi:hypothetical protein